MDRAELRASSPSTSQPRTGTASRRLSKQDAENDRRSLEIRRKYAFCAFCCADGMVCKARATWQMLEMDFTRAEWSGCSESFLPAAAEELKSSDAQIFCGHFA